MQQTYPEIDLGQHLKTATSARTTMASCSNAFVERRDQPTTSSSCARIRSTWIIGRELLQDTLTTRYLLFRDSVIRFCARSSLSNVCVCICAGRCRIIGGHAPQTCEQYEAQRGYEDVCRCPGCGVYVVKGDGERGTGRYGLCV